jgi:TolB protein
MADFRLKRNSLWWLLLLALVALALILASYLFRWRPPVTAGDALPSIVYIGHDASGKPQLFRADVRDNRATTTQLTDIQEATILEFAVAPNGASVALATEAASGGGIWLFAEEDGEISQVLDCPEAECLSLVWAPDGRRLVYERRERPGGEEAVGLPHLWWLDTGTGATVPVLEGDFTPAYAARFSPDGQWLSYAVPARQGIVLYNLRDGRHFLLPSQIGAAPAWSHDSRQILFSDLELITYHGSEESDHLAHSHDYEEAIQLYSVNVGAGTLDGERTRLSPEAGVDDALPAWSPDGQWIAFGRKPPRAQSGRQLWLMRPDGSNARALTNEPAVQHGQPHWSPDGRFLLFQRYRALEPDASPEIWSLNTESGEMKQVAADGYLPAWMP